MGPDEDPAFPVPTFQAFPSLPVKLEFVNRPYQSQARSKRGECETEGMDEDLPGRRTRESA